MLYMKANFKYAAPVADNHDVRCLQMLGVECLAHKANRGDVKCQAVLQRLVNSGELPEGSY